MDDKKFFRLDLSIAVEASSSDEAFEILTTDQTIVQIKKLINESKDAITQMFNSDEHTPTIIN